MISSLLTIFKIFYFEIYFFLCFLPFILLLFKYSCLPFLHTSLPYPRHPHLSPLIPSPLLVLSMCPFSCSWKPCPPLSSPTSPLVIVRLFLISKSLVIFSFLYVPCFRGHVCEDVAVWNIWDFPAKVFLEDFYGVTTYI